MSETQSTQLLEEIIQNLTGALDAEGRSTHSLREDVQRAVDAFDGPTATSACAALVENLSVDPSALRTLEALILLGLAHPQALVQVHVPLGQEGKRLALLLERNSEIERAQALLEMLAARLPADRTIQRELASMLRRTGNADRLIERYMKRAQEAVEQNRPKEAIPWLQEVLLIDRSRRDVARMIRDLRFQDAESRSRFRRRLNRYGAVVAVTLVLCSAVWWEGHVENLYAAIPAAQDGDMVSLQERLNALDDLMTANPVWLGMMKVSVERSDLRVRIQKIEAQRAESELFAKQEHDRRMVAAESARRRGRASAEHGDFNSALVAFREALEVSPDDWNERARVQADVDAILAWQQSNQGEQQ